MSVVGVSCDATFPTQPTAADIADWTPPAPITSIELFHTAPGGLMAVGSTFGYRVFAVHADGVYEQIDHTAATWTSLNPAVARPLGSSFRAESAGTAEIVATYRGVSASMTATVVSESSFPRLALQPGSAPDLVRVSTARAVYVERPGNFEDVTAQAMWASSKPHVATVQGGQIRAIGQGTTEISASYNGVTGFYNLSVTDVADRVTLDAANRGTVYRVGDSIKWWQRAVIRLGSARTGTFYFALVDQHSRVLSPRPWASQFVALPGAVTTFSSDASLPAGTTQVCSQVMLVTESGVRRTFAGTCNEVQ